MRREAEGPGRMAGEPFLDLVLLVRPVVVENDVDGLVLLHQALDPVEEADEFLKALALHVLPETVLSHTLSAANRGGVPCRLCFCGPKGAAAMSLNSRRSASDREKVIPSHIL